jgi:hypothetical protein
VSHVWGTSEGQLVGGDLVALPKLVAFSTTGSLQTSSSGSVADALGTATVDAEVSGGRVVVAAAVVDVAVAGSGIVMGVATVDVSIGDGMAVPVCKPPRKLPAATEMPRSTRRRCIILPSTETFSKGGAIFCLLAWSRVA